MVGTMVVATPDAAQAAVAHARPDTIGVCLFARGTERLPGLGATLPDRVRELPGPVSAAAWDFLAIASAVFAADRFVLRTGSADGWTRSIGLRVSVADPAPWLGQVDALSRALRFLTGDVWHIEVVGGGAPPPEVRPKRHGYDAVCLFSGGLDSFLGALHLKGTGARPLLVSQGSPKEISPQRILEAGLGLAGDRFEARIRERWRRPYEPSTRSRSLLFYGYGVVAAAACGLNRLIVPENALIAINPPLTRRRIGSLSTRTVHPHLLKTLNEVLAGAGVGIRIDNPFFATTKGEMLAQARHPRLSELASQSYSCGKGKRGNGQCGRCVPCLIRRASFSASGVDDATRYLHELEVSARNDDVLAARQGAARAARLDRRSLERWVLQSGPLPSDQGVRGATVEAVGRGLAELGDLFGKVRWR
jgi:hypothetical protein